MITGPPASGKNTIGEMVARRRERCAAIDVSVVRRMAASDQRNAWEGEAGRLQQTLGVKNAASIARNFHDEGFDAVISDVVTDSTLDLYKKELGDIPIHVVLLLPSEEEIIARMLSRPDYLSRGEMSPIYDQQARFLEYDSKVDSTHMEPDDVTTWVCERWPQT